MDANCRTCQNFKCRSTGYAGVLLSPPPLETLHQSAEQGCVTCDILWIFIKELLKPDLRQDYTFLFIVKNEDHRTLAKIRDDQTVLFTVTGPTKRTERITLYRLQDQPCPWEAVPTAVHVPTSTKSPEALSWVNEKLAACLQSHPTCNATQDFLPTRLVDVGFHTPIVKLTETFGIPPTTLYLALSHCWGPPESITTKLTTANYANYKQGIPISSLPLTFQHAVELARSLSVRYIWIDSLCIIQDDAADWRAEAATMCSVYQHSHLTIAAAASSSGKGGLFYESPMSEATGVLADGRPYSVFARREIKHMDRQFPLLKRGWVLQERVLSPRMVFFGEHELLWECRECQTCQCSPHSGGIETIIEKLSPEAPSTQNKAPPAAETVRRWHDLVEAYTELGLTVPGDIFAAIYGIADCLSPLHDGRLLAGMWEDSMASDLAWRRSIPSAQRLGSWRAPTWSWASIQGPVFWDEVLSLCPAEERFGILRTPRTSDVPPTVGFSDRAIRLRGVVVPLPYGHVRYYLGRKQCYIEDVAVQMDLGEDVYCLRLLHSHGKYTSIVLCRTDPANHVYERIGIAQFTDPGEPYIAAEPVATRYIEEGNKHVREGSPPWWEGGTVVELELI
ncbi:uncharacterized protein DNG_06289 [Cephalotrichum gorgonifer]|uniref:Heterokaryon incompatibility domain-containing protein n=1 Tax=Cephalotrichum gorgonifer TaxID=2041049 RepID=A0AAE8MZC4_9PEZI|nr:uncharacterized protein DNG_06289 [Cephalotrichum gorgonifer]